MFDNDGLVKSFELGFLNMIQKYQQGIKLFNLKNFVTKTDKI
jgi:hypothetical protein